MSMQEITIEGFRSLAQVTWRPGKLNVVIGPNGSGKSNLLRALGFLRAAALGKLPEEILRAGGIAPLLHDRAAPHLLWSIITSPVEEDRLVEVMRYQLVLKPLGTTSAYRVEDELLVTPPARGMVLLQRHVADAFVLDAQDVSIDLGKAGMSDEQPLLALFNGPFVHRTILAFRDRLLSWGIYHDLRVDQQALLRQAAVSRVEDRLAEDGQNLVNVLHTHYTGNRDFKRVVDDSMRAAFGVDYEELVFPPAADQRVQLRVRWRSLRAEQSAADLSDGTLRFLLLLAILANPRPGDLIAVDEPEVGLHPRMLAIVAELAAEAAEHTQVVLTTHSPELLDAFGKEVPTTTVARWASGKTDLAVLGAEELAAWLGDYRLGASFRSNELEAMMASSDPEAAA
jgi:predicted ATPase